jgi:hypothetical protein
MFPPMTQWPSITHYPIMALPRGFLPLARLSLSDQHGAAITGTGAPGRFTRLFGPGIRRGDRLMRAGVLACQSEAVAISTSAIGRGALTVVATDRADVPLASAVGLAVGRVLGAELAGVLVSAAELAVGRVSEVASTDRLAVQDPQQDQRQDQESGPQRDQRQVMGDGLPHGQRTGQLGVGTGVAATVDSLAASTVAEVVSVGASTVVEAVFMAGGFTAEASGAAVVEVAFVAGAVPADGDPILGLSMRSSCSAISTTALASIASFIMEAKKPMSELSRRRCKGLSRRRSCAIETAI